MHFFTRRDFMLGTVAALAVPRLMSAQSPTKRYTETGYEYDETSEDWKTLCVSLPCFAALHWPDYDTKVIDDTIDGQRVVIQLWKGFCPQFLNSANMPGGTGAEVGVYRRIPGKTWSRPSGFPVTVYDAIKAKAANTKDDQLWWPYPELKAKVDWELINPENKDTFIGAPVQTTYWRNKWMQNGSYAKYKALHRVPGFAVGYNLRFAINGKTYPVW